MADDYQHACADAAVFDLSDRALVELAGKDAVSFLHNLCTNDIKSLAPGSGCEAFLCTSKARVVGHFFVSRFQRRGRDVLWLDMVPGLAAKVSKQLDHYLISEEVELADRTADYTQLHVCGPRAGEVLGKIVAGPLPDVKELHHWAWVLGGDATGAVRRHDYLGLPGYDLFLPRATGADVQRLLAGAGAAAGAPDACEVLRVEAGFPAFGPDIDEDRFVVEVGRIRQAICYTKGCYLGQEPIVMARDRGHVNRTLLGLRIHEDGPAPAGSRVLHGEEEVGRVTSSVWSPRLSSAIALAYLRRGSQEPGTPVEVEAQGSRRAAEVATLPFLKAGGTEASS
jgi:folate-binding protein YgfZ